ncbi:hypothetical protein EDD54_3914 [Oharaeibacter diazotrophicus]|uniref:Uncharacterized protein n=1 Tax=Oharaeibacter diazotrophicus TaxID=1920512 RepID=A0A4R6R9V0_9HYPH|nr:hypothetical protein EDD54_3914 [Oharaeibacter diazotrophicus]
MRREHPLPRAGRKRGRPARWTTGRHRGRRAVPAGAEKTSKSWGQSTYKPKPPRPGRRGRPSGGNGHPPSPPSIGARPCVVGGDAPGASSPPPAAAARSRGRFRVPERPRTRRRSPTGRDRVPALAPTPEDRRGRTAAAVRSTPVPHRHPPAASGSADARPPTPAHRRPAGALGHRLRTTRAPGPDDRPPGYARPRPPRSPTAEARLPAADCLPPDHRTSNDISDAWAPALKSILPSCSTAMQGPTS